MMERRTFLKLVGAAGLSTLVPAIPVHRVVETEMLHIAPIEDPPLAKAMRRHRAAARAIRQHRIDLERAYLFGGVAT